MDKVKWFGILLSLGVFAFLGVAVLWEATMSTHMDGFIPFLAVGIWAVVGWLCTYILRHLKQSPAPVVSLWILGFYGLFGFNLLVEAFVLPYFGWDNTPDNDWYFQLWWVIVLLWAFLGPFWMKKKLRS
ncbi:MAG: hypothetical protein ACON42_07805 [Flavobacteriaceae bacterium]